MPGQKQPTEPVPSPAEAAIGNERPEYPVHRIDREQGIPTVPSFHWINDNGRQRLSRREHRYHLARSPPTRKPKDVLDADQASHVLALVQIRLYSMARTQFSAEASPGWHFGRA